MDIPTYSVSKAHKKGVSGLVKEAESSGMLVINRNDSPVAMIVPLQLIPFQNYIRQLQEIIDTDIKNDSVPDEYKSFAYFLRGMSQMQIDMFSKL